MLRPRAVPHLSATSTYVRYLSFSLLVSVGLAEVYLI
jgi:hypothetical protein